jgi:hypothetical protein
MNYSIKRNTIVEALTVIDEFLTTVDTFKNKYKNYDYEVSLLFIDDVWETKMNIKYEKVNNKTLQETT